MYGALLLVLIRRSVAARLVLVGSAGIVFLLTIIYGLIKPMFSGAVSGIPFTLLSGTLLSVGLIAVAKYARPRLATFFVSFLAVQCILNALLDLKTVFFLSSPFATAVPTDAMNMANATGIPAVFWAVTWIAFSLGILFLAMRLYVSARNRALNSYMPLAEIPEVSIDSRLSV
ncbi:MAG TPA: M50 family metallopeptidase, partial [Pyrinomonadaceae bacterium]|nr:M50 family metallopeptidase [Pyrinomonadaceae bacterium]